MKSPRHVALAIVYSTLTGKVLMITSRKHPHLWILPKGGIEEGETSGQAAVRESWEEAGTPKGMTAPKDDAEILSIDLAAPKGKRSSVWHIHAIETTEKDVEAVHDWPEAKERKREWMTTDQVLHRIREWYTDYSALTDLLESEDLKLEKGEEYEGDEEREVKKKSRKKEAKGGAMEQAFMTFLSSRGLLPSPDE